MPVPAPRKGETQVDFMGRCHHELKGEFTDQKQRTAVCFSAWRKKHGGEKPRAEDLAVGELPMLRADAEVGAESIDLNRRTFDVTFTSGAPVLQRNFWTGEQWLEILSLDPKHVRSKRLNSGNAPFLNAHQGYDATNILGVVQRGSIKLG